MAAATPMLDTLRLANRMKKSGVQSEVAEAIASSLSEELAENISGELCEMGSKVGSRFENLEIRMDARFEAVDARFTDLETRMDARFTDLETRITGRFSLVDEKLAGLRNQMHLLFGIALLAVLIPIVLKFVH